jgi:hypothetical protein
MLSSEVERYKNCTERGPEWCTSVWLVLNPDCPRAGFCPSSHIVSSSFYSLHLFHNCVALFFVQKLLTENVCKVKLSLYRPWRPLGLQEVEAPTFSDIQLIDGGKVVSPTRWQLFTTMKIPGIYFC